MIAPPQALTPADAPVLDAFLARWALAGAYARSHLRERGLAEAGVRAVGALGSRDGGPQLEAVLVADEGIGWALWRAPEQAAALAGAVPGLGLSLLSGPRSLVEPLVAHLPPAATGTADYCPFERVGPGDLRAPPPGPGSAARRATLDDLEPLVDFYIRGFYSLAQFPTRAAWRTRLGDLIVHRTLYLVEQDGIVVSAAQSSAETADVAMIGGVATVPAYRNRGLSTQCVYALCAGLFATGKQEIGLFYLPTNTPAARVYAKLGFQAAGEWWLQRLYYW